MNCCYLCGCELDPAKGIWLKVRYGEAAVCRDCAAKIREVHNDPCKSCGESAYCPEDFACKKKQIQVLGDLNANQTV